VGTFAIDPPTDDPSISQLVQVMAGFDASSGAADGLNAAFVNADTSQHTFLTSARQMQL